MVKNMFVGNLPFSATEDSLNQLFSQYGVVATVSIIKDKFTGQSRGFGFVEMSTEEEARKAIAGLNGYTYEGRAIVVKEALPKPTYTNGRPGGSDRRGGFGGRGGSFGASRGPRSY